MATLFSWSLASLILAGVGISYLVNLDYQSTHEGMLIDAWSVRGAKNNFFVMEKFQYGLKNNSCLIKRRTGRNEKQSKKVAKKKKLGTTRKVWLYKDGHCTDSSLRQHLLESGLGFLAPLFLMVACGFGYFCFVVAQQLLSLCVEQERSPVPQSNKESHVSSTEIEVEMAEGGSL